jgi:hypothetical protein
MVYLGIGIIPTIFWIAMLIDVIRREFNDSNMKLIWVLVIALTHFLGAVIYYFAGRTAGRLRS